MLLLQSWGKSCCWWKRFSIAAPGAEGMKGAEGWQGKPPPAAACSRYREDDAAGRRSFHHWCQEKLSDAAAVARSAYTVTWRELLDYNKPRWNQWLLMKNVFHPELLTLLVQRGSLLLVLLPIAKGMCWWAAAWRCSWCRAWNWTEITVLSRL